MTCKGQRHSHVSDQAWIELLHAPPAQPNGAISIITAYGSTASLVATVAKLRSGAGATFKPTSHATVAGLPGLKFDGEVVGKNHIFTPFTPQSSAARFYPDAYKFDHGEVFRIMVLNAKGKSLVLLLENAALHWTNSARSSTPPSRS